ncbi:peptidyl-tRNA hydrolase [Leucogyrophana mollusca]|uniref:Peptidyl-tRNA hydrolase n=1 Tax=Leucogyrophana mollusca TaxID=85980 RepID=A0ACB8B8D0_9AGAM|nr:peptidyl-tRNA hydrolase [Leucogyrophana mollusca]
MSSAALYHTLVAGASLGLGFYLGSRFAAPQTPFAPNSGSVPESTKEPVQPEPVEEDDEDEDIADGDLNAVQARMMQQCKLVGPSTSSSRYVGFERNNRIAGTRGANRLEDDLGENSGTMRVFGHSRHATLACYKALSKSNPKLVQHWERTGQAKIALKAPSEDELLELEAIAKSLNLCARSILDAGRTQIEAGSRTVLGIGPAPVELINQVTGHLRLL